MKKLFVAVLALGLVACGGGSSGDKESSSQFGVPTTGGDAVSEISSANDSFYDAQPVRLGTYVTGSVSESDEFDYYSFTAEEGKSFLISLTGETNKDIDITLYNNAFQGMDNSSGDASEELISYLAPYTGTYYLEVEYYDGGPSNYQLSFVTTSSLNLGDTSFCVDSNETGQLGHQLASASGVMSEWTTGACPDNNYVSQCEIAYKDNSAEVNMYFSQGYVDTIGDHDALSSGLCAGFNSDLTSANYYLL